MNKDTLVAKIAEKSEITKKDAKVILDSTIEAITEALVEGEKVQIVGFGTFEVVERAARNGVNPLTQERIQIPASKAPKFKAGKALKDAVKES